MNQAREVPEPQPGTTWLPNIITGDTTLSDLDWLIYALIAADDQRFGICDRTPALFAQRAKRSVRAVKASLALLVARKLIVPGRAGERKGWHAPLDIVYRSTVASNGAVLVVEEGEGDGNG